MQMSKMCVDGCFYFYIHFFLRYLFACRVSCFYCPLLTFFSKLTVLKTYFRVSNGLDQVKNVIPDLYPNWLQRLSAEDISRR